METKLLRENTYLWIDGDNIFQERRHTYGLLETTLLGKKNYVWIDGDKIVRKKELCVD